MTDNNCSHVHAVVVSFDYEQKSAAGQQFFCAFFRIEAQKHAVVVSDNGNVRHFKQLADSCIFCIQAAYFSVRKCKRDLVVLSLDIHKLLLLMVLQMDACRLEAVCR